MHNLNLIIFCMFQTLYLPRGYAFLCYLTPEHATSAIQELNNHEIRPGVNIAVSKSDGNKRLYMGNIHKEKTQEELLKELQILFTGVKSVFVQQDVNEPSHNRGLKLVCVQPNTALSNLLILPLKIKPNITLLKLKLEYPGL